MFEVPANSTGTRSRLNLDILLVGSARGNAAQAILRTVKIGVGPDSVDTPIFLCGKFRVGTCHLRSLLVEIPLILSLFFIIADRRKIWVDNGASKTNVAYCNGELSLNLIVAKTVLLWASRKTIWSFFSKANASILVSLKFLTRESFLRPASGVESVNPSAAQISTVSNGFGVVWCLDLPRLNSSRGLGAAAPR